MPAVYRFTSLPPAPPLVSVTRSAVYFADGTSIKYLRADGTIGIAIPYPGGPQTVAGFAVSPDDRRVAVALLAFQSSTNAQPTLDLYVEDLGGGSRIELFRSTTVTEWPIAWNNGHILLAVGPPVVGNASTNPYNAFQGYHVADAANGNRLVTMSNDCLYGPLVPTGTACDSGGQVMGQAFDGTLRVLYPSAGTQSYLAMSPDGSQIAGQVGGASIVAYGFYTGDARPLNHFGNPMGWIDSNHLVFYTNAFDRGILDLAGGSVPPVIPMPKCTCGNSGVFFGAFPVNG